MLCTWCFTLWPQLFPRQRVIECHHWSDVVTITIIISSIAFVFFVKHKLLRRLIKLGVLENFGDLMRLIRFYANNKNAGRHFSRETQSALRQTRGGEHFGDN